LRRPASIGGGEFELFNRVATPGDRQAHELRFADTPPSLLRRLWHIKWRQDHAEER
jgi:hypothetical protein